MLIKITNLDDGKSVGFQGVVVEFQEGIDDLHPAMVTVECTWPPLAIELLEHAIVVMKARQESARHAC